MKQPIFLYLLLLSNFSNAQDDLPLIEYPIGKSTCDYFILILSGDGGWHSGDQEFADFFHQKNIPTLGWDARAYFKKEKDKATFLADLKQVMDTYLQKWKKTKVVLMGYSFGADVLPAAVNQMDSNYQKKIKHLVLLAPSEFATYQITLASLLNMIYSGDPVLPEIKAIKRVPVFLVCHEDDAVCGQLPLEHYPRMIVEGQHRLNGKFSDIAREIIRRIGL